MRQVNRISRVFFSAFFLLASCGPEPDAPADPVSLPGSTIRVGILSKHALRTLNIDGAGTFTVNGRERTAGGVTRVVADDTGLRFRNDTFTLRADHAIVRYSGPFRLGFKARGEQVETTRVHTGELELSRGPGNVLRIVNRLPVETYAKAVARTETGATPELSAVERERLLGAMEIVVRSYAFAYPGRHARDDYDLCDLTHCMVYAGERNRQSLSSNRGQTRDVRLLVDRRGEFLPAYFHSTCGGRAGSPQAYWPENGSRGADSSRVYRSGSDRLPGENRDLCAASPHYRWRAVLDREAFIEVLRETPGVPRGVPTMDEDGSPGPVIRREPPTGRVHALVWGGRDGGGARIPIAGFLSKAGRRFGWNVIKSNDFRLRIRGDFVEFNGRGLGHGIGLCQWGARTLAGRGRTADEILKFYYPGARIARGERE